MRSFLWQSILLGFATTSTAIYKGNVATNEKAMGVVRLHVKDAFDDDYGSGVVLGNGNCLITAAHVVKGKAENSVKVSENKWEQNKIVRTNTEVTVSAIHAHPQSSKHDIAVVELASKMTASPWKVAQENGRWQDINLYGWGSISQGSTLPNELRSAVDKYRDLQPWNGGEWKECKDWRGLGDGAICIMSENSTYDPRSTPPDGLNCPGDSGGPGVIGGSVVGVASEEKGTCGFESQSAGMLASLFADEGFLKGYETKCGFQFGGP